MTVEAAMTTHIANFLTRTGEIARALDAGQIGRLVSELVELRARGGRLFLLGVGGSAANCSHAVNDFRKLCGIEAYSPIDNVSELTARTNDEGWMTVFAEWLKISRVNEKDALLIFSVGGGDAERNISGNLIEAIRTAKEKGARVFGVVGRDGGFTAKSGDVVVIVPTVDAALVTPLSEAFQGVVWHAIVSHPALAVQKAKWESAVKG
ncbi:MAG: SIS domain-containing protein [Pseudorhodoplanes sp.]